MPLSRNSVGVYQETSSHVTRQGMLCHSRLCSLSRLWTDPGQKSGISVRELISTLKKKKKKALAGNELSNILPKSSLEEEKSTTLKATTIFNKPASAWCTGI